jgi:heme A synthase
MSSDPSQTGQQPASSPQGQAWPGPARRLLEHRLVLACVLLMLLVVASSAALRLSQAPLACIEWPTCRLAEGPPTMAAAERLPATLEAVVRAVHRVAASAVLLIIVALLVRTRGLPPGSGFTLGRGLWWLLALALGLSALGIAVPGARQGLPMLGNLLGGLSMLGLAWALLRLLRGTAAPPPRLQRIARWAALAWLAQAASGAWSGAAGVGAGSVAPIVHLALAVASVSLALWLGLSLRGSALRAEGQWLLALLALQLLLGTWGLVASPTLAVGLLHNASAAAGLALLAGLALGGTAQSPRAEAHARPLPVTS